MQAFTKPADEVTHPRTITMVMLRAIDASLRAVANRMMIWMIERRRGQAAERLKEHLQRMSDAKLAKLGIKRDQIASHIKERLY